MVFSQLVTGTDSKKERAWEVCEVFIVCGYKGQSILSDRADTECVRLEQVLLPSRIMGNVVSRSVKGALSFLEVVHVETSGYPALALVDRQTHLLEQIGDRFQVMNFPTK